MRSDQDRNRLKPGGQSSFNLSARVIIAESSSVAAEMTLSQTAQAIRRLRAVRRSEFGPGVSEHAWDMLIELYVREITGNSTTANILQAAADVPSSTAVRWFQHLKNEGFIRTRLHSADPETEFVEMSNSTREALERYFRKVRPILVDRGAIADRSRPPKFGS